MRDDLRFASPLGPLGALVDHLIMKSYLTKFLIERNTIICRTAESDDWRSFISEPS